MICSRCEATESRRWLRVTSDEPICESCHNREKYQQNRERIKAKNLAYYFANHEQRKARKRAWWRANVDSARAKCREYANTHVGEARVRWRRWYHANIDYARALNVARQGDRRARLRDAETEVIDLEAVYRSFGGRCGICCEVVERAEAHFDHAYPLSKGGSHTVGNLQPAHPVCNQRKGSRLPAQLLVA